MAIAALIEAYRLTTVNVPLPCLLNWQGPNPPVGTGGSVDEAVARCNELARAFFTLKGSFDVGLVLQLLVLAPLVAGVVIGAPMGAGEIEQGTASLSWVHSGSRRRWLIGKALAGAFVLVPLILALGLAADALESASSPALDPYASFDGYLSRGVIEVFWALAAFAGSVALGVIFGRTITAVIVALVVCFFVRSAWDAGMTHLVLRPFATAQAPQALTNAYYEPQADMNVYDRFYLDGQPFYGDVAAWYAQHPSSPAPAVGPNASPAPGIEDPGAATAGPTLITFVIPGSRYWNVVALEAGLLLLGALISLGVAMLWVERRRPY